MLSKLCKENLPEACNDCLSITCKCTCHKRDIYNEEDSYLTLDEDEEQYD